MEPAVKRPPLVERKKRKLAEVDSPAPVRANVATDASHSTQQTTTAVNVTAAATTKKLSSRLPNAKAKVKKARKTKVGSKPAENPKQLLLRTVALGNLQTDSKAEAVTLAQAAGKVPRVLSFVHTRGNKVLMSY